MQAGLSQAESANLGLGLIKLGSLLIENSQEAEAGECFNEALAAFERSLEIAPGDNYIRNRRDQLLAAFNQA